MGDWGLVIDSTKITDEQKRLIKEYLYRKKIVHWSVPRLSDISIQGKSLGE